MFFGQRCVLCAARHVRSLGLCEGCLHALPTLPESVCPQCALYSVDNAPCGQCLKSPPAFDATLALYRYAYPVDAMLHRYKYQHRLHLGEHFAQMLATRLADCVLPELIVPMPLHPARLAERGFNQSLEVAKHLGRRMGVPVEATACARVKPSPPQASLPLKARVKNMKGAFNCAQQFEGRRIAIVDDVMTTGASLNELARTLKAAGAAHVECWVVARTLPHA